MMAEPEPKAEEPQELEQPDKLEIPVNKEKPKKKFMIIGFPNCGTTSLEQWLKSKGAEVIRWETLWQKGQGVLKAHLNKNPGYKPTLITRADNRYHIDCDAVLEEFKDFKIKIFKLEDLQKEPDFPKLNEKGSRIGDKIQQPER